MRKVILNLAVSLDGFIEGPNGEFDWCYADQDYGMEDFMKRIDTIFFGRKSYEVMLKFEALPYPDKMKYIFSNSFKTEAPLLKVLSGNVVEEVRILKQQPGKDIWLFGGAELITTFVNNDLIDELQLSVHPLLLGKGKLLFSGINNRIQLSLTGVKPYDSGLVQMFYELGKQSGH
ncbi:MAG TPA: dihydrofolate reductase family protein [Cytophagales bacterium]|nr:dihydrofolate reductase family protein [Cytophagales bacterium]